MTKRTGSLLFGLCLLVILVFILQLLLGSVSIPFTELLCILTGQPVTNQVWANIVIESRLPASLAAILAGAGLSASGLQMQTMFRNPVAGPYVLGISAGASLGVAIFIMAASAFGLQQANVLSSANIVAAAAAGAILIFLISFFISLSLRDVVAMLIVGLMIGGGISALIEILQSFSSNEALKRYVLWSFGSFRYINLEQVGVLAALVAAGLLLATLLTKSLNLLLLGDTYAISLGLSITRAKILIVLCTSLLAGSITAFCGPIGFVGLAVPHVVRAVFKTADHKILTPACALTGAVICGLCNIIAATPGSESILPINAVTSVLGAPAVIWIILRQRKLR